MRLTEQVRLRSLALVALFLLGACQQDDGAPRPEYTGRLHVTYTNSVWQVAVAPADTKPRQSVADAKRRAHSAAAELGGKSTRVYFGLFTGADSGGGVHDRTPAWLVVGTHTKVGKTYQYGVIVFSDDLTQPWVSTRLTTAAEPVVY
jgi:hypothetical protein